MVRAMGNPWFGSKATSGLCQALIAMMPPHAVYIETHQGGGAVMRRKPAAPRNIGIDLDGRALSGFRCNYPVELVHGCCHRFLSEFAFDGSELVYGDPPYLRGARKSSRRYRHDYEDADHVALLELLRGLPCAVMVSGYPSALYDALRVNWLEITSAKPDGTVTYRGAFVTSLDVDRDNVAELADCARARWKIENETFNVLKQHGYHLEHNFGHGKDNLAAVLVVLNLLAFALHTACELAETLWQRARRRLGTRYRLFEHLRTLAEYQVFPDWNALLSLLATGGTANRPP